MHCFSFDIETVPDVDFGRRMWDLGDLSDDDVATAMQFKQLQKSGREFLPLHQHRIVAISVALRTGDSFRIWSLGDAGVEVPITYVRGGEELETTLKSVDRNSAFLHGAIN